MEQPHLKAWLDVLDYSSKENQLFLEKDAVPTEHPYSIEMWEMLRKDGDICANAVFDVEGLPTVAFFEKDAKNNLSKDDLDQIRQKLWNQNLVSVVLVLDQESITAYSVNQKKDRGQTLTHEEVSRHGWFSAGEISSSEIQQRLPLWFKSESRVDKKLLKNLGEVINLLTKEDVSSSDAQILVGQILFISYLEHREIVSDIYRQRRGVHDLYSLISNASGTDISKLISSLQDDFNGDFLSAATQKKSLWMNLNDRAFNVLSDFLSHVDLQSGQTSFWKYDFSQIPVELLSGIYESFLGDEQKNLAAYYTPRHLANLTIDQALIDSPGILNEVVLDGACGSGILLTTFFRRLLSAAEADKNRQLTLLERVDLLKTHIFGSDLNDAALRVTAFSLYLSLLERLEPRDVAALQDNHEVKLPQLRLSNLFSGNEKGDFFSDENAHLAQKNITLILSNPPWMEPSKNDVISADNWIKKTPYSVSNRQVASIYALRAMDYLKPGGRACLIMPVGQLVSPSAKDFLRSWLSIFRPIRILNFADLQQLLFKSGSHSCFVGVVEKRDPNSKVNLAAESFEYCVPKSDVSLALGRLTLQSGDRLSIQTQSVFEDHSRLATLMWGNEEDLALITKLRALGSINDFLTGPVGERRWLMRGGVHIHDSNTTPVSAEPLKSMPFIETSVFKLSPGVLHPDFLNEFPHDVNEVANITDSLMSVFKGPRVLFPDGFDSQRQLRSAYFDEPAAFTVSINAISGPDSDSNLLKFLSVFLRSKLASYFLIMSSWQVMAERNAVRNVNIKAFPFFPPEFASNPTKANNIIHQTSELLSEISDLNFLEINNAFVDRMPQFDQMVYEYFDLSEREIVLIEDVVTYISPSIRPRSFKKIYTPMQQRTSEQALNQYAARLCSELDRWKHIMGGEGQFSVDIVSAELSTYGANAIVRVNFSETNSKPNQSIKFDEDAVKATLLELNSKGMINQKHGSSMNLNLDAFIWVNDALYIARPLITRYWLQRNAMKDARLIVTAIQQET